MSRKPRIRVQDNPREHLREVMETLAQAGTPIEVFNIDIHRRDKITGAMKYLVSWDGQPYDRVEMLPALLKDQFGGGDYDVRITDPNKNMATIEWPIPIEGEPKKQEAAVLPYGNDAVGPATPFRPGATMPQADPLSQMGMYRDPISGRYRSMFSGSSNPYMPFFSPQQDDDSKYYRDKFEDLRREYDKYKDDMNERLRAQERALHEEKQARQNEVMLQKHELMMTQLQEKQSKEMNELRLMFEKNSKPKGEEVTDRLYQAIIESNKANTAQMMDLMRHDVDATKNQFELMQRQFDNQMKMNQEYVNQVIKMNDPSKNAEVFNILGAQATNMFTLITQVAESGLFGKGEESPWLDLMKQFAYGVKDLGEKFITNQQRQMQQHSQLIRQPQIQGYGSPPLPAGQKQEVKPPQSVEEDPRVKMQRELIENPIIKMALPRLYKKMAEKASAQQVAEDLMDHIDYMGRMGILPSAFDGILDNPSAVMKNVLELLPIKMEEDYANGIIQNVEKIVIEIREEQAKGGGNGEEEQGEKGKAEEVNIPQKEVVEVEGAETASSIVPVEAKENK